MTTLNFPALSREPSRMEWRLISVTQLHVSPLNGAVQTQEMPAAHWAVSLTYAGLLPNDARLVDAWYAAMRGRAGRSYVWNFGQPTPRGVGGGTPVTNGTASGASFSVRGGPLSTTGWLLAGDLVGINGTVVRLTADADTDSGGNATFSVFPPLRGTVADGGTITLVQPKITAMLMDDTQVRTYVPGGFSDLTIDLVEAL